MFKTLQDVFVHLDLCYTLHEGQFSKIHNRYPLKGVPFFMLSVMSNPMDKIC